MKARRLLSAAGLLASSFVPALPAQEYDAAKFQPCTSASFPDCWKLFDNDHGSQLIFPQSATPSRVVEVPLIPDRYGRGVWVDRCSIYGTGVASIWLQEATTAQWHLMAMVPLQSTPPTIVQINASFEARAAGIGSGGGYVLRCGTFGINGQYPGPDLFQTVNDFYGTGAAQHSHFDFYFSFLKRSTSDELAIIFFSPGGLYQLPIQANWWDGALQIDPAAMFTFATRPLTGGQSSFPFHFRVPYDPRLLGTQISAQAIALDVQLASGQVSGRWTRTISWIAQ